MASHDFGALWGLFCLVMVCVMIAANWVLFEKAGEPGWASLIPIYNVIVMCRIGGVSPWLVLGCLIPFINIIFGFIVLHAVVKAFGKDFIWTLGVIFLGIIVFPMLAFTADYQRA